jgi:hypothetical protein
MTNKQKRTTAIFKLQRLMNYADVTCLSGANAMAAYTQHINGFKSSTAMHKAALIEEAQIKYANEGWVFVVVTIRKLYVDSIKVYGTSGWAHSLHHHILVGWPLYESILNELESENKS